MQELDPEKTPKKYCQLIKDIASKLDQDYILRSGGADGADLAFESTTNNKEIYYSMEKIQ